MVRNGTYILKHILAVSRLGPSTDIQISPEIDIDGDIVIDIDMYPMINYYCNLFLYIGIDIGSRNGYQKMPIVV